jgi:TRAP transporter TAXI family solute receptor
MKKRILLALLVSALVASLLGFGVCAEPTAPAPTPWKWPTDIQMHSMAVGTSSNMLLSSWTPVLEKTTGMKVRVFPASNPGIYYPKLKDGSLFSLCFPTDTVAEWIESNFNYAKRGGGPFPVRAIWSQMETIFGYMVRADSGIKTWADAKGKRFAVAVSSPTHVSRGLACAAWAGLEVGPGPEKINWVKVATYPDMIRAFLEGRADITQCYTTAPQAHEAAALPGGIRWIPMNPNKEPEAAARYREVLPTVGFAPAKVGVASAHGVWMIRSFYFLGCREDADPELVYHLCKWLDENFELYKDKYVGNTGMSRKVCRAWLDEIYVPIHDGAIKYYKEIGMWTDADQAKHEQNLNILNRYIKAFPEAVKLADAKGIKEDPKNKEWLEFWDNYKKQQNLPKLRLAK